MRENASGKYRPSRVSDEDIVEAARHAKNMRQLLEMLGLAAYGGNYEVMRRRLALLGIVDPAFQPRPRTDAFEALSREVLERAAANADGFTGMLRRLEIAWSAGAHRQVKAATIRLGVDTSHFLGRARHRGQKLPARGLPLEQILVAGRHTQTSTLKRRLLEAGLLWPVVCNVQRL